MTEATLTSEGRTGKIEALKADWERWLKQPQAD
jgi:hypothetical protein